MQKQLPAEYYRDLEEIQAVDFVLVELTLYLDTHPKDIDVINQFNDFAFKSQQLKGEFEKKYGALQQYGNSYADESWSWLTAPWPWQV